MSTTILSASEHSENDTENKRVASPPISYSMNNPLDQSIALPRAQTLHRMFEEQVQKTPHRLAVVVGESVLTYEELNNAANQLAHLLHNLYHSRGESLSPDTLIGLCLSRSPDMLIGMLGILKAGAAYVPISPDYPAARIEFILEDTQIHLVLSQQDVITNLKTKKPQAAQWIALDEKPYKNEINVNFTSAVSPSNLAYVMYTSGTTGNPKGVMIEHASFSRFITLFTNQKYIQPIVQESLCTLSLTQYIFDIFGLEYGLTLTCGGLLVISDLEHAENDYLSYPPTFIQQTPSVWRQLLKTLPLESLGQVLCLVGGEAVPSELAQELMQHCKQVVNVYGPTETTIWSTSYLYEKTPKNQCIIGHPLYHEAMFVLNKKLQPVPLGSEGELYIGGVGLARGYWNREQLTNECFIDNPFTTTTEGEVRFERLYKTGDLVRLLPDGALEYLGRNDFQVKIWGHRIELAEIERSLLLHPSITECIVLAIKKERDEAAQQLIAFVVSAATLSQDQLIDHAVKLLPEYMVPSAFIQVPFFSLTINGKIDRQILQSLAVEHRPQRSWIAPKSIIEQQLAAIWAEEIGLPHVSVDDNFFGLGGHSLIATRIVSRINHDTGKKITLADFYRSLTIAKLIPVINDAPKNPEQTKITAPNYKKTYLRLTDFQFMLWACQLFEPKARNLNVVSRRRFQGPLNKAALQLAFTAVIEHHEALRYRISTMLPAQSLRKHCVFELDDIKLQAMSTTDYEVILRDSIDDLVLFRGWHRNSPFIIGKLFHMKNNFHELQICMSHVVADELSTEILFQELSNYYQHYNNDQLSSKTSLPLKKQVFNFSDYICSEQNQAKLNKENEHFKFWQDYLRDTPLFAFPPEQVVRNMARAKLRYSTFTPLTPEITERMKQFCAKHQVNLNEFVCAALAKVLSQRINCCHPVKQPLFMNIIKSARLGRHHENTIGCFVRMETIKFNLDPDQTTPQLAKQIHQFLLDTHHHQPCSTILKLVSLKNMRANRHKIHVLVILPLLLLYTKITHLFKLEHRALKFLSYLTRLKRENQFMININIWSSFLQSEENPPSLFDLALKKISNIQYELLNINNLLEVCFLREPNDLSPWLVISANLQPSFRESIAKALIEVISESEYAMPWVRHPESEGMA
jgi:amino acid adenylation domain-containing protein